MKITISSKIVPPKSQLTVILLLILSDVSPQPHEYRFSEIQLTVFPPFKGQLTVITGFLGWLSIIRNSSSVYHLCHLIIEENYAHKNRHGHQLQICPTSEPADGYFFVNKPKIYLLPNLQILSDVSPQPNKYRFSEMQLTVFVPFRGQLTVIPCSLGCFAIIRNSFSVYDLCHLIIEENYSLLPKNKDHRQLQNCPT
ncbi:hypothetical protein QAD02_021235 [Eretmocerus hayati]|uniref:Uncharacterized protein n=1 Tax=Eretmocerus hayati TaxID=131215 RepID=A0ACC2PPV5_9HYME|nr:hypothetical protein QAD02_021235 [Eretmocerus hayati]